MRMSDTQQQFYSRGGQRRVLVVEEEGINRDNLAAILRESYELLFAETGEDALAILYDKGHSLSAVLLALKLPDVDGLDVLRRLKGDLRLAGIPVVVMTSDIEAEVESLNLGAIDFIPKPYPLPNVILARLHRTIELFEDRHLIRSTERDQLTGLYSREYFYRYAEQLDFVQAEQAMDAIAVNVNHFRMLNERYGKRYGDGVLCRIAKTLHRLAGSDGIVGRSGNDVFLLYCPHRTDYAELLAAVSAELDARVRLRMGVYPCVDKCVEAERRFDRAKTAADTVRNSYSKNVAIFDSSLLESELFAEQLLEDFPRALEEKQFLVYYQPMFDIRGEEPILSSAEALVRWKHPQLGFISPDVFIPSFESNGLVTQLDSYVWRETARQLREWKERLGVTVPVSVNVSRVDMFDPELLDKINALITEFDLTPRDFLLEITESAYTEDSAQIIRTVTRLREAGFSVEMDDFGSGYSSLNMLSSLPVDALKLDMQFLRNAFRERKNIKLLDVVIDIAESLDVPTVAEGVETAEQLLTLKSMGCDIAQGFYFSQPIPPAEYERFLLARKDAVVPAYMEKRPRHGQRLSGSFTYNALHDPLTGLYNQSAYEVLLRDADQSHIALMLASLDGYELLKTRNGREVTDRVIERVAEALRHHFRSVDYICRISENEFVVIITRINSSHRDLIAGKVEHINLVLQQATPELPAASLSAGVAFADRENPRGDIFQDAEAALNRLKGMKLRGCAFA